MSLNSVYSITANICRMLLYAKYCPQCNHVSSSRCRQGNRHRDQFPQSQLANEWRRKDLNPGIHAYLIHGLKHET